MTIEEKLALSQQPVRLISEGIFLKLFNQSLFVAQQHLPIKLKCQVKMIKKINQPVISSGIPATSLLKYFPEAVPTLYGYEWLQSADLSAYPQWYASQCQAIKNSQQIADAAQNVLQARQALASPNHDGLSNKLINNIDSSMNTVLTSQQRAFLLSWQPNKYPVLVDHAFIAELKSYFHCE